MAAARRNWLARLNAAARRFVGVRSGSATVELALILPVAISILGLVVFGGEGMSIKRKVTLATRDVGDLVAQTALASSANTSGVATIDAATLNYYLSLSSLIVYPYDPTQLAFEVSEILVSPPSTTATVVWSQGYDGGTARACNSTVTLSSDVVQALPTTASSYLILAESQYNYQPPGIGNTLGAFSITAQIFMVPRSASQIALNPKSLLRR